ncbi:MAG: hypothetical protein D6741_10420 [Planctomycetota bacterium]|nr:MAG: hypothetical protein D6741_10420 [Planctomycetota bacterium]
MWLVVIACGIALPKLENGNVYAADTPAETQRQATPRAGSPIRLAARNPDGKRAAVCDIELDENGFLQGVVVNMEGVPIKETPLSLFQGTKKVAVGKTNNLGQFRLGPFAGGSYHLMVRDYVLVLRTWKNKTAPPNAKPAVLVVIGDQTTRGQRPIGELFHSDVVVVGGLVAAAIAIPLATANDNSSPSSP